MEPAFLGMGAAIMSWWFFWYRWHQRGKYLCAKVSGEDFFDALRSATFIIVAHANKMDLVNGDVALVEPTKEEVRELIGGTINDAKALDFDGPDPFQDEKRVRVAELQMYLNGPQDPDELLKLWSPDPSLILLS